MNRQEFLESFKSLVTKYKYRVYRKYPNVRGKNTGMKYGRALFAWCHVRDVNRGVMLTPIMIVYLHKYYMRRIRKGKKAKFLSYLQERRAAVKLGISEFNYTVISAATDKEYTDLSAKQLRIAEALRKSMLEVCVKMGRVYKPEPVKKKKKEKDRGKKRKG